jgi:hypothetical protein
LLVQRSIRQLPAAPTSLSVNASYSREDLLPQNLQLALLATAGVASIALCCLSQSFGIGQLSQMAQAGAD